MRTAVVGLGVTGMSCLRHLAGTDELVAIDTRRRPPALAGAAAAYPQVEFRLGARRFDPACIDRVILSPGMASSHPLIRRVLNCGLPVLSDIDLFLQAVEEPVHAVTGTNGKSTTTALVGHLLAAAGRNPGVGGNLGNAALDLIAKDRDCYVLELSSFQLERLAAPRFRAAAILNLSADHLDWHGSLASYVAAKQRIYQDAWRMVANRQDARTLPAEPGDGELVTFGEDPPASGHWGVRRQAGARTLCWGEMPVLEARQLPLRGSHNEQNALAALALVLGAGVELDEFGADGLAAALEKFAGLPHRCEIVARVRGATYVNDSKATNPAAAIAALRGLSRGPGAIVLIAGGEGKGADFTPLGDAIAQCVRRLVVLGLDGPAIDRAVRGRVPVSRAPDMEAAVARAAAEAQEGDTVLLSPACASFDLFDDFQARGEAFRAAVRGLGR